MFDAVLSFSQTYCIPICALLVPLNLLATLVTLLLWWFKRPTMQLRRNAVLALVPAILIIFHVLTWLAVGVVMAPTYILFFLGTTCLVINGGALLQTSQAQSHGTVPS